MSKVITPLHNFVLVKKLSRAGKSDGGIALPEGTDAEPEKGEVIAVGPGHWENGKFIEVSVCVGDVVYMRYYKGVVGVVISGTLHFLLPEVMVIARVEEV